MLCFWLQYQTKKKGERGRHFNPPIHPTHLSIQPTHSTLMHPIVCPSICHTVVNEDRGYNQWPYNGIHPYMYRTSLPSSIDFSFVQFVRSLIFLKWGWDLWRPVSNIATLTFWPSTGKWSECEWITNGCFNFLGWTSNALCKLVRGKFFPDKREMLDVGFSCRVV